MKTILGVFFILTFGFSFSQNGLEKTIRAFYSDLNRGDSAQLKSYFLNDASITFLDVDTSITESVSEFLKSTNKFKSGEFNKHLIGIDIVETGLRKFSYNIYIKFYLDGEFIFCGIDEFIFLFTSDGFKIDKVYSTVVECDEFEVEENKVGALISKWHKDVAEFNIVDYFDFMDTSFVFLGTDPSERWTKDQFSNFCKPYFNKQSTWNFKTNWRNIYFSDDGKIAWFEESLDTQMDECRGSGVLVKKDGEWKIIHYNLTVLIENEKMKEFLILRSK